MTKKKMVTQRDLIEITKWQSRAVNNYRQAQHLTNKTKYTIDELLFKASEDRLKFAGQFLDYARLELGRQQPSYRLVINRSYYAMYHSVRALVYLHTPGDDHEKHSVLPQHLPKKFPDRESWENKLKNARLERNRADYDPYPKLDKKFAADAEGIYSDADSLLPLIKKFLGKVS